jgi:hypothetical protein
MHPSATIAARMAPASILARRRLTCGALTAAPSCLLLLPRAILRPLRNAPVTRW